MNFKMHRKILIFWQSLCLIVVISTVYFGRDHLHVLPRPTFFQAQESDHDNASNEIPKGQSSSRLYR